MAPSVSVSVLMAHHQSSITSSSDTVIVASLAFPLSLPMLLSSRHSAVVPIPSPRESQASELAPGSAVDLL
ncbi:hypothetical protein BJ878DRAFT_538638 [Calycina marina]|uniref:Uncharacterized protein n=1 Tax=Calycina marina TaxID=1763456 RepID=A0A9P8CIR6_9HELO|nr:hypothetical protein BJ878DRAFT_538638 [Calycina marina]